jgi:hypothetical protein
MNNDLLTALLNQAGANWNMDEAAIQDAMNRMAFHESKYGTPEYTPMQISDKSSSGYGPGRGLYQYEIGDQGGAHTAINRLISFNKRSGNKYDISFLDAIIKDKSYDFSQLTPEEQSMLFLADKLIDPTANMGTYDINNDGILSNEELSGFHADEHWAGYGGAEDFIFNLKGGVGPTKPINLLDMMERHAFMDKTSEDYQFYKP